MTPRIDLEGSPQGAPLPCLDLDPGAARRSAETILQQCRDEAAATLRRADALEAKGLGDEADELRAFARELEVRANRLAQYAETH